MQNYGLREPGIHLHASSCASKAIHEYVGGCAVGAFFWRTVSSPGTRVLCLINGSLLQVSRVEFRRRVYGENLQGGVKILSVEQVRLAPSQLEASTTNYQGYWDRLQPWLRREITAAMVPEASNAQREHAFAVIGHVMQSPSGVQMVAFTSAVENFMSATRALKFWDEVIMRFHSSSSNLTQSDNYYEEERRPWSLFGNT